MSEYFLSQVGAVQESAAAVGITCFGVELCWEFRTLYLRRPGTQGFPYLGLTLRLSEFQSFAACSRKEAGQGRGPSSGNNKPRGSHIHYHYGIRSPKP